MQSHSAVLPVIGRRDPCAVILDAEFQLIALASEADHNGTSTAMFDRIVHSFLGDAIQVRCEGFASNASVLVRLERALDGEATAGAARQFLKRGGQALCVETDRK
jgi:hypothetical protein